MGSGDRRTRRSASEEAIHGYIAACNTGDADAIAAFFAPGAVHYFPQGYGGPARGGQAIGATFARLVPGECLPLEYRPDPLGCRPRPCRRGVDRAADGLVLRGDEWYEFDPDTSLITEIRGYLASPPAPGASRLELQGFPYAERGYTLDS